MSRDQTDTDILYRRTLPGGGFVVIRVRKISRLVGGTRYRGEIIVERRADMQRRQGHVAPVVLNHEGPTRQAVMHELFPVAHSNTTLAGACIAFGRRRTTAGAAHFSVV
jgi:hypothetical protein